MSEVRVVDTGLEQWTTECQTLAAGLISNAAAPPATGPSSQATSSAVLAAHSSAVRAANLLSGRLQSIGLKSHVAAVAYDDADQNSAQQIAGQVV